VTVKITVFWDITPCIFSSLREHSCLHQGRLYSFHKHSFLCDFRETNFLSSKWFSAVVSDGRRRVAGRAAARGAATGAGKKKSAGTTDKERAAETANATASGGSQARDCADWEVSWRGESVTVNVWITPTISVFDVTVCRSLWLVFREWLHFPTARHLHSTGMEVRHLAWRTLCCR